MRLPALAQVRKIAAITGSVGKTGTKEALAHILSAQESRISKQPQQSLGRTAAARLPASAAFGVLEIGMNHGRNHAAGRPRSATRCRRHSNRLCAPRILQLIVEDMARAKGEVFSDIDGGTAIINRDTQFFRFYPAWRKMPAPVQSSRSAGTKTPDMRLIECRSDVTGNAIKARWRGDALSYHVAQPGVPLGIQQLTVLAAADAMGADLEKAAADLATIPALRGRGAVDVIPWGAGMIRLIEIPIMPIPNR